MGLALVDNINHNRENIISLNIKLQEKIRNVFSEIENNNTKINYTTDFNQFLYMVFNKDIYTIVEKEIESIDRETIINYRQSLIDFGLKNSTINRKIIAIKCILEHLSIRGVSINILQIFTKLKQLEESGTDSYSVLEYNDALKILELAKEESQNALQKYHLINLAIKTSFRLEELLSLTVNDFKGDIKDNNIILATVTGKGNKKNTKPIKREYYQELINDLIQESLLCTNEQKIFNIHKTTANRMIKRLAEKAGLSGNYVFHSLKSTGILHVYDITKSVTLTKQQGNHSSFSTTERYYMNRDIDWNDYAGMSIDNNDYLDLSTYTKQELLMAINECSKSCLNEIIRNLKK